jgi:C4-dicarboxylate-binding protein DctP
MRIQSSKVLDAQMRALGVNPQVMAFSEVYQARQAGVVDGTENPPSNLYTQKMHEVQKYVTLSDHGYIGYAVITNKAFWDGLPAEVRATLETAMKESTKYAKEIAKEDNDSALAKVRESGKSEIISLTPEQKLAWKRALVKVHKQMEDRVGAGLIQSIYQATGCDCSKL